jgi:hypothetical protein
MSFHLPSPTLPQVLAKRALLPLPVFLPSYPSALNLLWSKFMQTVSVLQTVFD